MEPIKTKKGIKYGKSSCHPQTMSQLTQKRGWASAISLPLLLLLLLLLLLHHIHLSRLFSDDLR
jgi:hypothetical protein